MRRGLVHVYTGNGKGKTTAALGLAVRGAGHGLAVHIVQFLKAAPTGEVAALQQLDTVCIERPCTISKFYDAMQADERLLTKQQVQQAMKRVQQLAHQVDVLILDEVFPLLSLGLLHEQQLLQFVQSKPAALELVLTGRDAPSSIVSLADYVSEIHCVKHPYDDGIAARKGVEF